MKFTRKPLVTLPGCEKCRKVCRYRGAVAAEVNAKEAQKTPYGCNTQATK